MRRFGEKKGTVTRLRALEGERLSELLACVAPEATERGQQNDVSVGDGDGARVGHVQYMSRGLVFHADSETQPCFGRIQRLIARQMRFSV
jgi:hypothetical protein